MKQLTFQFEFNLEDKQDRDKAKQLITLFEDNTEETPKRKKTTRKKKEDTSEKEEVTKADEVSKREVLEPKSEDKNTDPSENEDKEPSISKESIRAILKDKVGDHRDAIKAKLTELGAPNVSALKAEKHEEFYNYLETL